MSRTSSNVSSLGRTLALLAVPAVVASLYVVYRKKLIRRMKRRNSFRIVEDRSTASIVENKSLDVSNSWNCLGLEQPLVIVREFVLLSSRYNFQFHPSCSIFTFNTGYGRITCAWKIIYSKDVNKIFDVDWIRNRSIQCWVVSTKTWTCRRRLFLFQCG